MTRNSYRCTPTKKFAADGIPADLAAKIAPHLQPIEYDRWSELHWKAKLEDNLTAPETQELAALESANMQTIGDVYDALQSDTDMGEWIERIQGHE
ncbi:MAG: hypothetical protein ACTSX0_03885 [Promethearchaeota archaeon]